MGGIGLLAGFALHWAGTLAALWLLAIMLDALMTRIRARDTAQHFVPPIVVLCLAALVAILRWGSLAGTIS